VDAGYGLLHANIIVATTDDVLTAVPPASALELVVGDRRTSGPTRDLGLAPGWHEAQLGLSGPDAKETVEAVRLFLVDPDRVRRAFGARTGPLGYDMPVVIGAGLEGREERTVFWEDLWRDSALADVVVDFEAPYKFVLWRGTGYVPAWTANNSMTTNFFAETVEPGVFRDCCEPMSDRECRYSRARILHSSPARAVIHWRYALCDATYEICRGYWADELFYVYPDGVAVRNCTVRLDPGDDEVWQDSADAGRPVPCSMFSRPEGKRAFSNMEFITVNPPGSSSEDITPPEAFTMLDGGKFSETYSWPHPPAFPKIPFPRLDEYIFRMNYRDRPGVFLASPAEGMEFLFQDNVGMQYVASSDVKDDRWLTVEDLPGRFADFLHWPVTRGHWTSAITDPGMYEDRPTHTFLGFAGNAPVAVGEDGAVTWSWLCGIAPESDDELRARANSWLRATQIDGATYDPRQAAYVANDPRVAELHIAAGTLVHRPTFVLPGMNAEDVRVFLDGKEMKCSTGIERHNGHTSTIVTLDGTAGAGMLKMAGVGVGPEWH